MNAPLITRSSRNSLANQNVAVVSADLCGGYQDDAVVEPLRKPLTGDPLLDLKTTRVEALSDGVCAIVMTISFMPLSTALLGHYPVFYTTAFVAYRP